MFFLLMIFPSTSATAFDSNMHVNPTKDAFALYEECQKNYPKDLPYQYSDNDINIVSDANEGIDSISFSRAWNWHFYDSEYDYKNNKPGHIKKGFLGINRSLHKFYLKASEELTENIIVEDNKELLESTGVVMHFIQDMAVPAHVAPIYHVTWSKDPFDGYSPSIKPKLSISPQECRNYLDKTSSPIALLEELAQNTLSKVHAHINKTLSWEDYWNIYPEKIESTKAGFSTYGKCGREAFGNCNNSACNLEKSQYDNFYNSRYEDAVLSSLQLLMYIEHNKQAND